MSGEARFVDIGGRSLYTRISRARPVVMLNGGAGREGVRSWTPVETRLAEFTMVVTYDRAGLGRGAPTSGPPTALDMAEDLERLR